MEQMNLTPHEVLVEEIWGKKGTSEITLSTLSRVFKALGIATATLDLGASGKVALW